MVSAISNYSNSVAMSGIYQSTMATPIADQLKETAKIASSYYSLSDKVEAVKSSTENNSSWLYNKVNEIGMPQGLEIEGVDDSVAKNIVVNIKTSDITNLSSKPKVDMNDLKGKTEEEEAESMDLNGDGTITVEEAAEYVAMQLAQSAQNAIRDTLESEEDSDKKSATEDIEDAISKKEELETKSILYNYKNGINSYTQNIRGYEDYLHQTNSYVA